jgi:hypothetical protein
MSYESNVPVGGYGTNAIEASAVLTNKTAACAVSLGVALINGLVGSVIDNVSADSHNKNEMMASIINTELQL